MGGGTNFRMEILHLQKKIELLYAELAKVLV